MKLFYVALFFLISFKTFPYDNILEYGVSNVKLKNCILENNTIHISGSGRNYENSAFYNFETTLEELDIFATITLKSYDLNGACRFGIGKKSSLAGTFIEFISDINSSKIVVCRWDNSNIIPVKEYSLNFKFTLNSQYKIKVGKRIRNLRIEILSEHDYFFNDELYYPDTFFGCLWGTPIISCYSGSLSISDFSLTTPYNKIPRITVWGDSFIEGNSLDNVNKRYVSLLKDSVGYNQIAILGKGGESSTSVKSRLSQELLWFKGSKYAILAIGVNDNNFETWKENTLASIAKLREENYIPIIGTLSPRKDRKYFIQSANDWIREEYHGPFIDFHDALSSEDEWREGAVMEDGIHPTELGHKLMFSQIVKDAPFLFNNSSPFHINFLTEMTQELIEDTLEVSYKNNYRDSWIGSGKQENILPGKDLFFKHVSKENQDISFYSALFVPNRPMIPNYKIDYLNEQIAQKINPNDSIWSDISGNVKLTYDSTLPVIPGSCLFFMKQATFISFRSEIQSLIIPSRPMAPKYGICDGLLQTFDWELNPVFPDIADYEYSLNYGNSWLSCLEKPLQLKYSDNLPSKIYVRVKATVKNFSGEVLSSEFSPNILSLNQHMFSGVSLYPNPVTTSLFISNIPIESTITMLSFDGKIISKFHVSKEDYKIDLEYFNSGMYSIIIDMNGVRKSYKVIKI